jgi:hypothetical protein
MRKMLSWHVGVDNLFRFDRRKSGAHGFSRDVEKESASDCHTHQPLKNPAEKNVHGISQNLSPDDSHSQPPSPPSVLEPTNTSECKCYREQKEQQSYRLSEWCKIMIGAWIQSPHTVKNGAGSCQAGSGDERDGGPKEQESTDGSDSQHGKLEYNFTSRPDTLDADWFRGYATQISSAMGAATSRGMKVRQILLTGS